MTYFLSTPFCCPSFGTQRAGAKGLLHPLRLRTCNERERVWSSVARSFASLVNFATRVKRTRVVFRQRSLAAIA
jgi:hypothetical protein